jgi:glycosyltransferase involved in cell wall biosynthesis
MKICVLLDTRALPTIGGGYTFEQQLFQALLELAATSEHEFVVFTLGAKIPQKLVQETKIQFVALGEQQKKLRVILAGLRAVLSSRFKRRSLKRTRSLLTQFRYAINQNILEMHGVEFVWSLTPLNITLDTPYIVTVWDLEHRTQPYFPEMSRGDEWDQREYLAPAFRRATYVLTGTQIGKMQIERFYQNVPDRIKVLPLPTPQYALEAPISPSSTILSKYGLSQNGYLFYPAQFWPHKNHANLLYAAKLLNEQYGLNFPIVFVGSDKNNRGYIQELAQNLGLLQQVHFLGFVPQEELVTLYQGAFALTFMSLAGPDNIPPLEAFALGCPVIASNVSGAQEQLGNAALIVDGSDEKQIALAIKSLHESPELRQQVVQKGYQRAAQWTSHDYVREVLKILDEFEPIRRCWP